jgi:hypothetical protein
VPNRAADTLTKLGANLRDEVNLDNVLVQRLAAVDETMQPESVNLWIRGQPATGVNLGQGRARL